MKKAWVIMLNDFPQAVVVCDEGTAEELTLQRRRREELRRDADANHPFQWWHYKEVPVVDLNWSI